MIRLAQPEDIPTLLDIWLAASVKAHAFVPGEFWESQIPKMRDHYLPNSETWVHVEDDRLVGFISYVDGILAALFVDPVHQGTGIGSQLLAHLKQRYSSLQLTVYQDNPGAIRFYTRHGFTKGIEGVWAETGAPEVTMAWPADSAHSGQ